MPKPTDPSRDLLIGLLALQTGLIDQGGLFAAFAAWTRDKGRSLADHLVELGHLDSPRRAAVEAIAHVHVQALGGEIEKSLAVLAVGRSTRESLVRAGGSEVEATLGHVRRAPGSTHDDDEDPDRTASYSVGSATSDGQRFRILRPHARGGLGAVFVALDGELHREVALKQILEQHADDPDSRQRFVAEAEITGGLEHPGVVPVYGSGTDSFGRPYYAMRFIKGDSLKDEIARFREDKALEGEPGQRSLELRKLLRRFTDVCNAIDYAHTRGVIHRDLKPANIIMGKHGETLVVDWGLAKSVGRADPSVGEETIAPSSSGSSETLPGSALGTPSYMSPEQARGELSRLGPRSDVYSLGATLYCLLTGKPPFEGEDIGEILRAVQDGHLQRPSQHDPSLDKALEAVCLKAMAKEPEGRYPTPKALADDLDRWMADEPVLAWREPFARRARRWARRNRTKVTAAAVALVAGVVGLSAVLAVQARANGELTKANGLLTDSVRRETKANADLAAAAAQNQARFDLALEAIKTFHTGVSEDVLLKNDNLKSVRDRLLNDAAEFYKRLGDQLSGQADRGSRRALGQAYASMAGLAGEIGATEQAIAGHRQALAVRRGLAEEGDSDGDGEATADVGRSLIALGNLLGMTGRTDEALTSLAEARTVLLGLARARPAVTQFQRDLAESHHHIGALLSQTGKPAEALASYQAARATQRRLADANPAVTQFQSELAGTQYSIGMLLEKTGELAEALASFKAAREIQQRLADANPALIRFHSDLAGTYQRIGLLLFHTGKPAEALASMNAARVIQQKLVDANPALIQLQRDLAESHNHIGVVLNQSGFKPAEALASFKAARVIQQMLVDANPTVIRSQRFLAGSHHNIGYVLKQTGELAEALASLEAARVILQKLVDANPTVTQFQFYLANTTLEAADVLRLAGQPAEARTSFEKGLAIVDTLFKVQPAFADDNQDLLVFGLKGLGAAQQTVGQAALAVVTWRRAIATAQRDQSSNGEALYVLACCHARIGGIAGTAGSGLSAAQGAAELDTAMVTLRRALARGYRDFHWIKRDPDLDPLRNRCDFRVLMMDLAMPAEPFAR
jgi:serine/threonine protein kinase